jgi:hypothetical protein
MMRPRERSTFESSSKIVSLHERKVKVALAVQIDAENTNRPFLRYGLDAFVSIKFRVRFDSSKTASGYIERVSVIPVLRLLLDRLTRAYRPLRRQ